MSLIQKCYVIAYVIMRKTADPTVVQLTFTDTMSIDGKPQKIIAKEVVCSECCILYFIVY